MGRGSSRAWGAGRRAVLQRSWSQDSTLCPLDGLCGESKRVKVRAQGVAGGW